MTNDVKLREGAIAVAREAAGRILEVYDSEFAVRHKDDRSPLTAADLAAHHCIVDGLARLDADIPVLSEESAALPPRSAASGRASGWSTRLTAPGSSSSATASSPSTLR